MEQDQKTVFPGLLDQLQGMDLNGPGFFLDLRFLRAFSLAGQLIELLAVMAHGGIHGRYLLLQTGQLRQHRLHLSGADADRLPPSDLAVGIERIGGTAEGNFCDVLFLLFH